MNKKIKANRSCIISSIVAIFFTIVFILISIISFIYNNLALGFSCAIIGLPLAIYTMYLLSRINWFFVDDIKIVAKNPYGTTHTVYWSNIKKIELTDLEILSEYGQRRCVDGYIFYDEGRKAKKYDRLFNQSEAFMRIEYSKQIEQAINNFYDGEVVDTREEKFVQIGKNDDENYFLINSKIIYCRIPRLPHTIKLEWSNIDRIEIQNLVNYIYKNQIVKSYVLYSKINKEHDCDNLHNKKNRPLRIPVTEQSKELVSKFWSGKVVDKTITSDNQLDNSLIDN